MRRLAFALVALGLLAVLALRAEPYPPTVELVRPMATVGPTTRIAVRARDRGTGLARVEVRLVPSGGAPVPLGGESWPQSGWRGSGVAEAEIEVGVDAVIDRLPEGPAVLEVWGRDHSWLPRSRREPLLTQALVVDRTAPTVEVLTTRPRARPGGAAVAVYRVGDDAVESGIEVDDVSYDGVAGLFADPALRAALFAIPTDASEPRVAAWVADAVGNVRRVPFAVAIRPRRFAEKTLDVGGDFLAVKVPALLAENAIASSGDPVADYLRVNRDLRVATEARIRELCRESAPTPLWHDAFLRQPGAAPLAGFGDRRTYVHDDQVIDHQLHLGVDLASLRRSPVPAANDGRVVFTGPLGIYGNTVVLDHGLGVFSLYGHLSEITVPAGVPVARGVTLGRTGETGLAGGDHLHFSIMIRGTHVTPAEWWDGHWIQDNVTARLAEFPPAGALAEAAPRGDP